jgi:hypothetical protein
MQHLGLPVHQDFGPLLVEKLEHETIDDGVRPPSLLKRRDRPLAAPAHLCRETSVCEPGCSNIDTTATNVEDAIHPKSQRDQDNPFGP